MIRSLRVQLALSNMLPILLLMPLLSLYLLYSLESFFTPKLLQQLAQQARLLYDQVQADQTLVTDPIAAQRFVTDIAHKTDARVILLSQTGIVLASTRPEDADRIGISLQTRRLPAPCKAKWCRGLALALPPKSSMW